MLEYKQIEWPKEVVFKYVGATIISLPSEMPFIVICLYCRPSSKLDFYDQLKPITTSDFKKRNIMGDFIINLYVKNERNRLKQIIYHFHFKHLIEQHTRIMSYPKIRLALLFTN